MIFRLLFGALASLFLLMPVNSFAAPPFGHTAFGHQDVRRLENRVEELERQVEQMQLHIDQLADRIMQLHPGGPNLSQPRQAWTCRLRTKFSLFTATAEARGKAVAKVLKKCAKDSHALFCREAAVQCEQ